MPTTLHEMVAGHARYLEDQKADEPMDGIIDVIGDHADPRLFPIIALLTGLTKAVTKLDEPIIHRNIDYGRAGHVAGSGPNLVFPVHKLFVSCRAAADVVLLLVVDGSNGTWGTPEGSWHLRITVILHPRHGGLLEFCRDTYQDEAGQTWPLVKAAIDVVQACYDGDPEYNCGRVGEDDDG